MKEILYVLFGAAISLITTIIIDKNRRSINKSNALNKLYNLCLMDYNLIELIEYESTNIKDNENISKYQKELCSGTLNQFIDSYINEIDFELHRKILEIVRFKKYFCPSLGISFNHYILKTALCIAICQISMETNNIQRIGEANRIKEQLIEQYSRVLNECPDAKLNEQLDSLRALKCKYSFMHFIKQ